MEVVMAIAAQDDDEEHMQGYCDLFAACNS